MPLPEATLSLGPLTQPDATDPIKPKTAMLVRLSSAAIDALTPVMNEKEKVSVDLGSTPGIHIDGTFYPMRMQKEGTPHEIYLRIPRSNKGSALKLYANVSDKLFIEPNEIGDDLTGKIHRKTQEAAKQRGDRQTKFIEAPLIQPPKVTKKKKEPASMFRNPIRPPNQAKLSISSSSARVPSPAPQPSTKLSLTSTSAPLTSAPSRSASSTSGLFNRLIRCMATRERTRDAIIKSVAGDDLSIRHDILELLEEVGEPTPPLKKGEDAGSKIWRLKAKSWLHVRPMDWPGLDHQERLQLSRTGRMRLSSLGYSDNDPEWSPFAFRSTDISVATEKTAAVSSSDSRQRVKLGLSRSGISSREVKKPKPRSDPNAETPIKDESPKVIPQSSTTTAKMKEVAPSTSTTKKVPGPRAGKSQDPSGITGGSSHSSERDIKPPRHSSPPKMTTVAQTTQKEKSLGGATAQRMKKARELDVSFVSESERDRDTRPKSVVKHEERRGAELPTLKRKQRPQDGFDSDASTSLAAPQKKRKTENGVVAASLSSKDIHPIDLSLPKKPDLGPRQKQHKEPTSLPLLAPLPKINKKANSSSHPSTTGNVNKTTVSESTSFTHSSRESRSRSEGKVGGKRRRGSPIYTSSEDEGESNNIRHIAKATSPETSHLKPSHPRRREHEREPRPLPTDHASLRMRYTTTYGQCMAAFTTLLAQKSRIDSMLRNGDIGSVTDSDGDGELMDVEDLKKLSGDYERMHEELETIRQKFAEPVH